MAKDLNEHILLELLYNDPDNAVELIYRRYWKELYVYIFAFTHNKSFTEDILQETFFNLWKYKNTIHVKDTIIGYLKTSARNIYIRAAKSNTQNATVEIDPDNGVSSQLSDENDYLKKVDYNETEKRLKKVVDIMPKQMQNIFLLRKDEELSHEEIGQRLHIAKGTVKKQLYYALKLLRKNFSK